MTALVLNKMRVLALYCIRWIVSDAAHLWTHSCQRSWEQLPLWTYCTDSKIAFWPPETEGSVFLLFLWTCLLSFGAWRPVQSWLHPYLLFFFLPFFLFCNSLWMSLLWPHFKCEWDRRGEGWGCSHSQSPAGISTQHAVMKEEEAVLLLVHLMSSFTLKKRFRQVLLWQNGLILKSVENCFPGLFLIWCTPGELCGQNQKVKSERNCVIIFYCQ